MNRNVIISGFLVILLAIIAVITFLIGGSPLEQTPIPATTQEEGIEVPESTSKIIPATEFNDEIPPLEGM